MLLMALIASMAFVACDDSNDDEAGGEGGGGGTPTTVANQKQQLEATAKALMAKVDAQDFREIADAFNTVNADNIDDTDLEDWFDACKDACLISSTSTKVAHLYQASKFYAQFELQNGRWVKKSGTASGLQFIFNGYKLEATCSGKETPVHHEVFDDESYDYRTGRETEYKNTFSIPENVTVTLTKDGRQLVKTVVNTKLTINSSDGEVHIGRDNGEVTTTVNVNNYIFIVEKALFNGGASANASASAKFMKGEETLITFEAKGYGNTTDEDDPEVGSVSVDADFLGQVKVKGTISSVRKVSDFLDAADYNDNNEELFKQNIDNANKLIDLWLYTNGQKCAYLQYYPFGYSGYGREEWEYEEVIMFPGDDSGYETFEDYFDEDVFRGVIDTFESLVDDFDELIDD